MATVDILKAFPCVVVALLYFINISDGQRQMKWEARKDTVLPLCFQYSLHSINYTSFKLDNSISVFDTFSRVVFRKKQKLKCNERKAEIRTVYLIEDDYVSVEHMNVKIQNVISTSVQAYRPPSHFTSSGYFYDSISNTYYKPDGGDYCISRYSKHYETLKLCSVGIHCNSPSSPPHTWCVPKCCAIDEVFIMDTFKCQKISESDNVTPWLPPIYESPKEPHHKMHKVAEHIRFQMAGFPRNCKIKRFNKTTRALQYKRWFFASTVTVGNTTFKKNHIKLATPKREKNGILRPLKFHFASRSWRLVYNLVNYCVDGFYSREQGTKGYSGKEDEYFMVVCSNNKKYVKRFISKVNVWVYPTIELIGCLSFLATIVVYALIWKKLNLHGMTVLSFNVAAFGNYFFIGVWGNLLLRIKNLFDFHVFHTICYGTAVVAHYFFFGSHLWLVVMNFDLWLTIKSKYVANESKQWKVFSLYSLATWFFAFVLVTAFVIVDRMFKDPITEVPVPGYASRRCYVSPYFACEYVSIPSFILFIINLVLIGLTTRVFVKMRHQQNTELPGSTSKAKKYSVKLFAKMFIVMGVSYNTLGIIKFLLWMYNHGVMPWPVHILQYVVYLTPVYLFVAFCLNDRVIRKMRDKHPKFATNLDSLQNFLRCSWRRRQ